MGEDASTCSSCECSAQRRTQRRWIEIRAAFETTWTRSTCIDVEANVGAERVMITKFLAANLVEGRSAELIVAVEFKEERLSCVDYCSRSSLTGMDCNWL